MQPETAPLPNAFEALGLPVRPWIEGQTLQSRFVELAAQWHPDTNPDPEAASRFQALVGAHLLLRDPVKRLECVLQLQCPGRTVGHAGTQLTEELTDLFLSIATFNRQLQAFHAQQPATQSPLSRALLQSDRLALGHAERLNTIGNVAMPRSTQRTPSGKDEHRRCSTRWEKSFAIWPFSSAGGSNYANPECAFPRARERGGHACFRSCRPIRLGLE